MARMIPSFVDDRTPPGERDVFNVLAAGPDDWVILHSLDLAPWNRGLRTEVDFVVIVPDTGILCIEVKSHLNITFDGHRWQPRRSGGHHSSRQRMAGSLSIGACGNWHLVSGIFQSFIAAYFRGRHLI